MSIEIGDHVTPHVAGQAVIFTPQPVIGIVNDEPSPDVFGVLWEDGSKADGVIPGSLRKIVAGDAAVKAALPMGRPLQVVGGFTGPIVQPAQENIFVIAEVVNGEDDAGAATVFVIIVPLEREKIDTSDRIIASLGPLAGAVAGANSAFGTEQNGFQGAVFAALPGDMSPRY